MQRRAFMKSAAITAAALSFKPHIAMADVAYLSPRQRNRDLDIVTGLNANIAPTVS